MADTTIPGTPNLAPVPPVATPEQEEAAKRAAEAQQQAQMIEMEIARGRRLTTLSCLNLCNLAISFLPRPNEEEEAPKNKKNPTKRTLTIADLDKVSSIVERFTQSIAHLSGGGVNPMGMMGPRGPMMR